MLLQNVVHSLAQVILDYGESQDVKVEPLQTLLTKPHPNFIETLQTVINESTKSYAKRLSLLNYFLFEIKQLKPLIERQTPLDEEEQSLVQQHLQSLIMNVNTLLKTSQSSKISIKFDGNEEQIPGLVLPITQGWYPCKSGNMIDQIFLKPLHLQNFDVSSVAIFVKKLIMNHQQKVTIPFLMKERDLLKETVTSLEKEKQQIKEEMLQLKEEKSQLIIENEQLTKEKRAIWEEQQVTLTEKTNLEKELSTLKKELVLLRTKAVKPNMHLMHPFFGVANRLTPILPRDDSSETNKISSPSLGFPTFIDD
ncbi:hypothetical protein [Legionella clemsonensis]|uniref:Uncharacterized protein n=1 Tax=Legionella clemsonensis TaxID=1867846 RepID=A0A222P0V4_9GAMM|nr:hypothetical protein [Legionella clemsonensis]ASQ45462.1 hypothetical protein clem_04520 [Legionella clemsonensis]